MLDVAMWAAYASELWHELFVGVAGAAAALTGLLFVSLSINLQQILKQVWLPRRAGLTVMLLFEALVIAILGLVPGQSPVALGVELLGLGVGVWLFATGGVHGAAAACRPLPCPDRRRRGDVPAGHAAGDRGRGQPGRAARRRAVLAGAGDRVAAGRRVMNAWVLLVEILR